MKLRKVYVFEQKMVKMLKIEAIIRSSVLQDIQAALTKNGIPTFSVYQVQISGVHKAHQGWRNKMSDFVPKSKLEILCPDNVGDEILKIIQETARTGEKGDGIVYVYNINKLIKIRNGDMDEKALS
jgi:nitrogen regulatory protein P-II 1